MLMTAAVILALGIPYLLPSMHERYFFLAEVLTLVWACLRWEKALGAMAVQLAGLGAYHAYLVLRYAFYITLFGLGWGMALESLLLLAVLIWTAVEFFRALPHFSRGKESLS